MIYVFKNGSGYQSFPEPDGSDPYLDISGTDEARILAGDPYRLNDTLDGVIFPPIEQVEAERVAAELVAERTAMNVSRFQARAALFNAGLLASAETAIGGADALAQLAWADAQEFRRNSPTVAAIAGALSLTDEQLDDLFRAAKIIEA